MSEPMPHSSLPEQTDSPKSSAAQAHQSPIAPESTQQFGVQQLPEGLSALAQAKSKRPFYTQWWLWLIVGVVLVMIILAATGGGGKGASAGRSAASQAAGDSAQQAKAAITVPSAVLNQVPKQKPVGPAVTQIDANEALSLYSDPSLKVGQVYGFEAAIEIPAGQSFPAGANPDGNYTITLKVPGATVKDDKDFDVTINADAVASSGWKDGSQAYFIVRTFKEQSADGDSKDDFVVFQVLDVTDSPVKNLQADYATSKWRGDDKGNVDQDSDEDSSGDSDSTRDSAVAADLAGAVSQVNKLAKRTVIDKITASDGSYTVDLDQVFAPRPSKETRGNITNINRMLVGLATKDGESNPSIYYYLNGEEVGVNHYILDPGTVNFKGKLAE